MILEYIKAHSLFGLLSTLHLIFTYFVFYKYDTIEKKNVVSMNMWTNYWFLRGFWIINFYLKPDFSSSGCVIFPPNELALFTWEQYTFIFLTTIEFFFQFKNIYRINSIGLANRHSLRISFLCIIRQVC